MPATPLTARTINMEAKKPPVPKGAQLEKIIVDRRQAQIWIDQNVLTRVGFNVLRFLGV